VYPAAALVQWGLSQRTGVSDPGTYKGISASAAARRARIIDAISGAAPWLEINEKTRIVCSESDDCLDAVICALVARAYELNRILPVTDLTTAQAEGWIQLPTREPLGVLPSLSTSGETLTIEESVTLRARTENAGHVGVEHEWSRARG
jgi:hypothetical protein